MCVQQLCSRGVSVEGAVGGQASNKQCSPGIGAKLRTTAGNASSQQRVSQPRVDGRVEQQH